MATKNKNRAGSTAVTTGTYVPDEGRDLIRPAEERTGKVGQVRQALSLVVKLVLRGSVAWFLLLLLVMVVSVLVPSLAGMTRGALVAAADNSLHAIIGTWVAPLAMMVIVLSILTSKIISSIWFWYVRVIESRVLRWIRKEDKSAQH